MNGKHHWNCIDSEEYKCGMIFPELHKQIASLAYLSKLKQGSRDEATIENKFLGFDNAKRMKLCFKIKYVSLFSFDAVVFCSANASCFKDCVCISAIWTFACEVVVQEQTIHIHSFFAEGLTRSQIKKRISISNVFCLECVLDS